MKRNLLKFSLMGAFVALCGGIAVSSMSESFPTATRAEEAAEGRKEGSREAAKAMAKDGIPLEKISHYTGLSLEDIKSILGKP